MHCRILAVSAMAGLTIMVACGGTTDPIDTQVDQDVAADATTDMIQDDAVDALDDIRPDGGDKDTGDAKLDDDTGDSFDDDTDAADDDLGDTLAGDADAQDATGVDVDDIQGDGGDDPDTTLPGCEQAVLLTAGATYDDNGLPNGTESAWGLYSCDAEDSWDGPERIFAFRADCDGFARMVVTPSGSPTDEYYAPVFVQVLSACSPDTCIQPLPASHPVTYLMDVSDEQTVFFAVEAPDTTLPPFSITIEQFCRECRDDDQDGIYGFNEIYCPEGTDCNDDDENIAPDAPETACDGVDQDCSGFDSCDAIVCVDNDDDGYFNFDAASCPIGRDCNDSNADMRPDKDDLECNGIDENCDGLDWCPGTGQQCDSCLFMTGCRDDHVCMPIVGGTLGFSAYCAKLCDNPLHCPAGSDCVPDVYEGQGVCIPSTSAECGGQELTVTDACGNQVLSTTCSGDCSPGLGVCQESCPVPAPLTVGTTVSGRLTAGQSSISAWPGIWDADGPESAWQFTATCDGVARFEVTEMSDLEMFVVVTGGECRNTRVLTTETGDSFVHQGEFAVVSGIDFFVVIDSTVQDDSGPFTLKVDVDCAETGRDHCEPCELDLQCGSSFCHQPGMPEVTTGTCLDDCHSDGKCPDDSHCTAVDGRFVCIPSTAAECDGQELWIQDSCGLSYLDERCGEGWQCNAAAAACTNDCVDGDEDGYMGYDAETCPDGNDCADDQAAIHPAANDIRCNGTDEDCSGLDNCSDAGQCEPCEGGHCAPGYYCFVDPNYDVPGICLDDCTADMECPTDDGWNLSCWSWMSGIGDESYYCRPQVDITCDGKVVTISDGCGRVVETDTCDLNCFDDFGCVNYCTATQEHPGCGKTVHGTTAAGNDRTNYYYNTGETRDDLTGPEVAYTFTASCTGEMNAVLTNAANWLTLMVVRNSGGQCRSSALVAYDTFLDTPDVVAFNAVAGDEFTLVVDGMDGASGEFDLTVNCMCGAGCTDADSDGFVDFDQAACPSGNDCDGGNAAIHPGVVDTECNDVDEDCSGYDDCRSDACTPDVELGNLSSPISRTDGRIGESDEMTFYAGACASPYPRFNVETVYHFNPACTGTMNAAVSNAFSDQYDIYLLEGACRADLCGTVGWYELSAEVTAGTDYYLVIDGNASAAANNWDLDIGIECAQK